MLWANPWPSRSGTCPVFSCRFFEVISVTRVLRGTTTVTPSSLAPLWPHRKRRRTMGGLSRQLPKTNSRTVLWLTRFDNVHFLNLISSGYDIIID